MSRSKPEPHKASSTPTLLVSEIFGPTLQGEGPSAGRTASFLRLGRCNLSCGWCDSYYTWDARRTDLGSELTAQTVADVRDVLLGTGSRLVIVTGGEPALQRETVSMLAADLKQHGCRVELETSGSVPLGPLLDACDLIVVSPKLENSGLAEHSRLRPRVLTELARLPHAVFKFVVQQPAELAEVDAIVHAYGIDSDRIWIMPEGTDQATITRRMQSLADQISGRGWNLSGRLHISLWGNARGR